MQHRVAPQAPEPAVNVNARRRPGFQQADKVLFRPLFNVLRAFGQDRGGDKLFRVFEAPFPRSGARRRRNAR